MKRVLQIASIIFVAAAATGCANTKQIEADIEELKAQMSTVSAEAAEANERSKAAESSARSAEQTASDTDSKLDRMFKKSMMK